MFAASALPAFAGRPGAGQGGLAPRLLRGQLSRRCMEPRGHRGTSCRCQGMDLVSGVSLPRACHGGHGLLGRIAWAEHATPLITSLIRTFAGAYLRPETRAGWEGPLSSLTAGRRTALLWGAQLLTLDTTTPVRMRAAQQLLSRQQ
jgi:hypothetical protein